MSLVYPRLDRIGWYKGRGSIPEFSIPNTVMEPAAPLSYVFFIFTVGFAIVAIYELRRKRLFLAHVPGPRSGHFLLGNLPLLSRSPATEVDFNWYRKYGGTAKFTGAFGEQHLMISDPKAVQYIMQTAGYGFVRPSDRKEASRLLLGQGVLTVEGDDHKRQRRMLLPSFGSLEANTFVPSFASKAAQMADEWAEMIHDGNSAVDVPSWVARATLDAIGEAAFDIQFNALTDSSNELVKVYSNLFTKTRRSPSNLEIFMAESLGLVPTPLMRWWNDTVPNRKRAFVKRCRLVAEGVAKDLVQEKRSAEKNGQDEKGTLSRGKCANDVLSRLVHANGTADAKVRLGEDELLAQLLTILLAGHETTANSLSWALLELSQQPHVQARLRAEIRAVRLERKEPELTATAIHSMPYLSAVVKEVLRFHAPVYNTSRTAMRDDVIPLSRPLYDTQGRPVHEVMVPKGQKVLISIAAFNRDKDIFGADADRFDPERWLKEGYVSKRAGVGPYSSLLTFGGGHRACLGWRFAVLELSAFLVELVDRFEFSVNPAMKVHRGAASIMIPMIEGELDKGVQLPLHVKLASVDE